MKQRFKIPGKPVSKNGDKSRYVKYAVSMTGRSRK